MLILVEVLFWLVPLPLSSHYHLLFPLKLAGLREAAGATQLVFTQPLPVPHSSGARRLVVCGRFSHHTALVSWLIRLFHAPAMASKVSQLDYGALQLKNDNTLQCKARQ